MAIKKPGKASALPDKGKEGAGGVAAVKLY